MDTKRPAPGFGVLRLALACGVLWLSSCATKATPYVSAQSNKGYGYSEQQLEEARYRIVFKGNPNTPRSVVDDYLLYRAAEITRARGYDYFVLAAKDTESEKRPSSTRFSFGGFGFGGGGFGGGGGVSVGANDGKTSYQSYADVVLMKGPKPDNDIRSFSPTEILARMSPAVGGSTQTK